jgi:hypothetical protein
MEAAFAEACGDRVMGGVSADQLDMYRGEDGKLPSDTFRRMRIEARTRGRPPGSRNRANVDLAKLICREGGDPQLFLARVYGTPLDQLVEMLLVAEGVPEREERLFELIGAAEKLVNRAIVESWGEAKLKVVTKAMEAIERAASSLKSKPGDIALKALGQQIAAAKEVSPYVHSKKPVDVTVTHKRNVIMMPAPQAAVDDPIDAVMRRTVEALSNGDIDPARIMDMRFDSVTGNFVAADGGGLSSGDGGADD